MQLVSVKKDLTVSCGASAHIIVNGTNLCGASAHHTIKSTHSWCATAHYKVSCGANS